MEWVFLALATGAKSFSLMALWMKLLDWLIFWVQYFTILYVICLLLYNLGLKIWKLQPFRWPRRARLLWRRWWRLQRALAPVRLAFWRHRLGVAWGSWCCSFRFWGGELVDYFRECAYEITEFCLSYDFAGASEGASLGAALRATGRAFLKLYGEAIKKHGRFIANSAVGFLMRPFYYRWTLFRFFKHLFGWAFGFSFFYYLFLWCAYVLYMLLDAFFLFFHVLCFYFLKPLFFRRDAQWSAFLVLYWRVFGPPYTLFMEILYEDIPLYVKRRKDRIFSREAVQARIVRPLVHLLVRWLSAKAWVFYRFVTITAYYQTRYFVRKSWYLARWSWWKSRKWRPYLRRYVLLYVFRPWRLLARFGRYFRWSLRRARGGSWRLRYKLGDFFRWFVFSFKHYTFRPIYLRYQRRGQRFFLWLRVRIFRWVALVIYFSALLCWAIFLGLCIVVDLSIIFMVLSHFWWFVAKVIVLTF